ARRDRRSEGRTRHHLATRPPAIIRPPFYSGHDAGRGAPSRRHARLLISILTWGHPECATPEILALAERVITLRDPPRAADESELETGVVSVFEQPTQYFLHPFQRAPGGPWRAAGPSLALPLETPDSRMGEAVLYLITE